MRARVPTTRSAPVTPGAVAHGAAMEAAWIDLVVADDEWVRREFDELVAHGWGGGSATRPPTRRGAHGPRRRRPRPGSARRPYVVGGAPVVTTSWTTARAPPS
jgi:hypothetical protein